MEKKRVLIPVDGTERSMHSLDFIKGIFPKDSVEITLMNVKELVFINGMAVAEELKNAQDIGQQILDKAAERMQGYSISTYFTFGYAGDEILNKAKEDKTNVIIMTKSTKNALIRMIGSTTAHVVKGAKCVVMIVPE